MSAGPTPSEENREILHATCVAFGSAGVVLFGPSGSGKSALGLQLIALGADLITDDLVCLSCEDGVVVAHAPDRLQGVMEARYVGLLHVPHKARALVHLCVDMGRDEKARLPHSHVTALLSQEVKTIYRVDGPHFPAAVKLLLTGGRYA